MSLRLLSPSAVLLAQCLLAPALAAVIHAEDFESCSLNDPPPAGWSTTGEVKCINIGGSQSGTWHMRHDGDAGVAGRSTYSFSTVGYTAVSLSFYFRASSLDNSGESCRWWFSTDAGQSWSEDILTSGPGGIEAWTLESAALGPAADGNADVRFRFGTGHSSSGDNCHLDSFTVTGSAAGPSPTPAPPAPTSAPAPTAPAPTSALYDPLSGSGNVARTVLTHGVLTTGAGEPSSPVDYAHLAVPAAAANPLHTFEGTFELQGTASDVPVFTKVYDRWNYDSDPERLKLPPVSGELVQHGTHLVPVERGSRHDGAHPFWEWHLEPGRCWSEAGDNGLTRCSLPFALSQRNSNCVHNGVFHFLFDDSDIQSGQVWEQVASETCAYYKFDFSHLQDAQYTKHSVSGAAGVRSAYEAEVAGRVPQKDLAQLDADFPGVDSSVLCADREPDVSTTGAVVGGVHYVKQSATRYGTYPFLNALVMPTYSTGKSWVVTGTALALKEAFPSASPDPFDAVVGDLIPSASASEWGDVTVRNLLDMASGNYRFANYMRDEDLVVHDSGFFLTDSHANKLSHSLTYYSRKATPGSTWIYHTTDSYIALTALQEWFRDASGNPAGDIVEDFMWPQVWQPLGLSHNVRYTRRTLNDGVSHAFGGFGQFALPDDVAKIAQLFNADAGKLPGGGAQKLHAGELASLMQANGCAGGACGLETSASGGPFYYSHSTWKTQGSGVCTGTPYFSGYGGISIVMLPQGGNYYCFSDGDVFTWGASVAEVAKADGSCP